MNDLPIWFLVFALFVPRISLFVGWWNNWAFSIPQPLAAFVWVFLPRVLVVLVVYTSQGFSNWFWLHAGAAVFLYGVALIRRAISSAVSRGTK